MFKDAHVLVTGGAGFVGTNLVHRLAAQGASVRATLHATPPQVRVQGVEYVHADLLHEADCGRVCQGMDYVFLCAAVTSGAAVMETTPLVHLTPNLIMNSRMLEAAYAAHVKKVLFISSNTVYPVTDTAVAEDEVDNTFFDKYFIVAWMKRFSELMCEMYSKKIRRPMATIVVRPANSFGPFDKFDWEKSHVLPALIRRVVERHAPLKVWGDGMDVKDLIYVDDLVDGLLLAMEKVEGHDVLNLASGQGYRLRDVLDLIMNLDGYADGRVEYDTTKPTMIPRRVLDTRKAEQVLGFRAATSLEEGLRRTILWYRSTL